MISSLWNAFNSCNTLIDQILNFYRSFMFDNLPLLILLVYLVLSRTFVVGFSIVLAYFLLFSDPCATFLYSFLYWLSKQPTMWSCLFCSMGELRWPRMAIKWVPVCINCAIAFLNIGDSWIVIGFYIKQAEHAWT